MKNVIIFGASGNIAGHVIDILAEKHDIPNIPSPLLIVFTNNDTKSNRLRKSWQQMK